MSTISFERQQAILRGYYYYLNGSSCTNIREMGISDAEIDFIGTFHAYALTGTNFAGIVTRYTKRPKSLLSKMFDMFCRWNSGKPIQEPEFYKCKYSISILQARLAGLTDTQIGKKGYSDAEIQRVDKFLRDANRDMTMTDRSRKCGIPKGSIAIMIKLYKERVVS